MSLALPPFVVVGDTASGFAPRVVVGEHPPQVQMQPASTGGNHDDQYNPNHTGTVAKQSGDCTLKEG